MADCVDRLRLKSRHKKTTRALHRRFAVTSSVSTADVIRLPNWAGFCILGGFTTRPQNNKWSQSSNHKDVFTWFSKDNHYLITHEHVSYLSHIQNLSVFAGRLGGPPLRRGFGSCGQLFVSCPLLLREDFIHSQRKQINVTCGAGYSVEA